METTGQQTAGNTTPQTTATTPQTEAPKTDAPIYGGKFKSQADFESAHKSLEAKLHQQAQELAALKRTSPTQETADAPKTEAEKTVKAATSTPIGEQVYHDLLAEYVSNGAVSEDSLDKAAKTLGMPKAVIAATRDSLIAEQKKGMDAIAAAVKDDGVTSENINQFVAHMDKTLNQGQKNAIMEMLSMGNYEVLRPLAKAWSKGQLPPGEIGKVSSSSGGYTSREEYFKANRTLNMRDKTAMAAHEVKLKATSQADINKWLGRP